MARWVEWRRVELLLSRGASPWFLALGVMLASVLWGVPVDAAAPEEQEAPHQWSLTLGMGVEHIQSRDLLGSPRRYEGQGFPLTLEGRWHRSSTEWYLGASGYGSGVNGGNLSGPVDSGLGTAQSAVVDIRLGGLYRWPVHRRLQVIGGGQLRQWTFFRSYTYHPAQIGSVETWEATLSADLRAGLRGGWTHLGWELRGGLALAGRGMRPSHALRGDQRLRLVEQRRRILSYGQWMSLRSLQMWDLELRIDVPVDGNWSLEAGGYLRGVGVDDGRQTRAYQRGVQLGTRLTW